MKSVCAYRILSSVPIARMVLVNGRGIMMAQIGKSGTANVVEPAQTMKALTWQYDWSAGPLGAIEQWTPCLRTTVDIMLAAGHAMCLMWGPERIFLYNDAYAPVLGVRHPAALGMPTASIWSDVWSEIEPIVDRTFAGETCRFEEMPLTTTRNGYPEQTWWDFCYSPVLGADGHVAGLLNVTLESTARVVARQQLDRSREQQQLLNAELSHRIKNTMSVVQAIATQTLGQTVQPSAMHAFGDRLKALTASHDLLTRESWSTTQLEELARSAMVTFGEERFAITGPAVAIGPRSTIALSLLLHELGTNAVKYGALSVPHGRISLKWNIAGDGEERVLVLTWREEDGPPAIEPERKGFGSRIIRMGLTGSGGVNVQYDISGFRLEARAPLRDLQEA